MSVLPLSARAGAAFAVASGMLLGIVGNIILGLWGVFALAAALIILGIWTADIYPEGSRAATLEARDEIDQAADRALFRR